MSPYCPDCLGLSVEGESRCPLDQHFYHRRSCSACGSELYPREVYCAICGVLSRTPEEVLLLPASAGARRVLASMVLDFLSFSLLMGMVTSAWMDSWLLVLPLAFVSSAFYRSLGRGGGRQTFGQAVFHVVTVDSQASPIGFSLALKRTMLELINLPRLLLASESVIPALEQQSLTLEVALA